MKKIKFYSLSVFLTLFLSLVIFSCSHDEEKTQENNKTINKVSKLASPACNIIGETTVSNGTYSYTYTNSGNNSSVNWTITQNGNPVPNTVVNVVTGQGTTTVTINFSNTSSGIYRISAFGTGGIDGACEGILNVTKSSSGIDCSCTPDLVGFYNCRPNGTGGGAISIIESTTCSVNWSAISSVKVELIGAVFSGSTSFSGLSTAILTGPNNGPFHLSFTRPNCVPGSVIKATVTFNYNNGCPSVIKKLDITEG